MYTAQESESGVVGGWLTATIRLLVDNTDAVSVTSHEGQQVVVFEVAVAPEDFKRVVGRKGVTADALRQILAKFAGRAQRRYLLELTDPARRSAHPQPLPAEVITRGASLRAAGVGDR